MRTVIVEELTREAFAPFGWYADMINPDTTKIGAKPIEFFRDMLQEDMGSGPIVSFSTCRVEKRDLVIDVSEYHSSTGEGCMALDNDIYFHVAPATPVDERCPLDEIRVFRAPKGMMVVVRPGVWHHAPFTVNDDPASALIVLPERTYANDCIVEELSGDDQIKIEV